MALKLKGFNREHGNERQNESTTGQSGGWLRFHGTSSTNFNSIREWIVKVEAGYLGQRRCVMNIWAFSAIRYFSLWLLEHVHFSSTSLSAICSISDAYLGVLVSKIEAVRVILDFITLFTPHNPRLSLQMVVQ